MPFDGPAFVNHVAERLIHEFAFSRGAGTPGLVGAAKEHPARVQLEKLLPGGFAVGSGIVVDSYGSVSRQQDIVVHEALCPVFTHNGASEATYYPVEGVVAVGEVKSGFGRAELSDAVAKVASVKRLRRHAVETDDGLGEPAVSYRVYGAGVSFAGTPAEQFDQDHNSLDQVYGFVLCERFLSSPAATLENIAQASREVGLALAPNMVVSLGDGGIYPFNQASGSITRAMMDGGGAMFSGDPVTAFAQLVARLRLYATSGRTVERKHYERYFLPIGGVPARLGIDHQIRF